jgi:hypothetical protein
LRGEEASPSFLLLVLPPVLPLFFSSSSSFCLFFSSSARVELTNLARSSSSFLSSSDFLIEDPSSIRTAITKRITRALNILMVVSRLTAPS